MLSIIIPTLNEEKYLPLLLEEIKKQKVDEHSFITELSRSESEGGEEGNFFGSTHRSARVGDEANASSSPFAIARESEDEEEDLSSLTPA